jgi:cyclopropane fatty-acyl-phospholipid synthase-like methyltransferase
VSTTSEPDGHSPAPSAHYDRVTDAWGLLLGDELHYGVFATADDPLPVATGALTQRMVAGAQLAPGLDVLDVGCGTGGPARALAAEHGVRVTGITTSEVGVRAATERAAEAGLSDLLRFEQRDGTDNGFPDASFDRVWVLESSHLMRDRVALVSECARVLRPGGRMVLCDIILRREMPFEEVRRLRHPLALLRAVFGDARMEPLDLYASMATDHGLVVDQQDDLTDATRPTFTRWRENAARHRDAVVALLGEDGWQEFVDSCDVLEGFWDDGTLGYGLLAAAKTA